MNEMHNYALVRFSRRTGKIDTTMTALGKGLLKLWALQNTTKSKVSIIIDLDDEDIVAEYHGTASGFPRIVIFPEFFEFELDGALIATLKEEVSAR